MILPFATQNEGKLKEARRILAPLGIQVKTLSLELEEPDCGTVKGVTGEKLRQVRRMGYERAMVDDAGIFFAAYDGFPGILSKRIFEGIGYRGVMKLLDGEPREAWFEGVTAVVWDGETALFSAKTPGLLLEMNPDEIRSEPGFPFNPIFVPRGSRQTLSEMTPQERERYSYRGKSLRKLARWLQERAGGK